jgi:exopolyphosphatase/guanosine-5'-triphosphate,3'-diphosphate pyrophosphatase
MIISAIDIGTNTILMVTARVDDDRSVHILGDEHAIARLGKGVDEHRMISDETVDRVTGFLERYQRIAMSLGSERIVAFGTSALRDARNRDEFIATMKERTGISIEVLSGTEEAELTYRGALFGLDPAAERRVVLDIGGGSTEIAVGAGNNLEQSTSIDVGAVRITERFFTALPPLVGEFAHAREFARDALAECFDLPEEFTAIGVAGTVTTLAAMDAGMDTFNAEELNGYVLNASRISRMTSRLAELSVEQVAAFPQVPLERADVLLGGAVILDEFMHRYRLERMVVSTRGVRYGMLMREIDSLTENVS